MNDETGNAGAGQMDGSSQLPPWSGCDLFCIRNYAAAGAEACGWRGSIQDARQDAADGMLLCPSCGCASLFPIPPAHRSDITV